MPCAAAITLRSGGQRCSEPRTNANAASMTGAATDATRSKESATNAATAAQPTTHPQNQPVAPSRIVRARALHPPSGLHLGYVFMPGTVHPSGPIDPS